MGRIYKQAQSEFYYADFVNEEGKRIRVSTKCKTKRKAEEQLSVWENRAREIRGGIKPKVVEHAIKDTLDEYERASQKTANYIAYNRLQIERVCASQSWTMLHEIAAAGLEAFIAGLDASDRTKHSHITALRIFCRWCAKRGKLPGDPTSPVSKPSLGLSSRRMLERSEWALLKKHLRTDKTIVNGQDAQERLLMYWLAIETGLRSKELRSLTRADVVTTGDDPHVVCSRAHTKNKRDAKQYLSDELAKRLGKFLSKRHPAAAVFTVTDPTAMAEVLRDDCVQAGVKDTDVLDFHCLRHTTGSWLASAGVPLHEVQRIMRHSSITLTIDRYGHLARGTESRNRNIFGKLLG